MQPGSSSLFRVTRLAVPILGLAGTAISTYLTIAHYELSKVICIFNANCDVVLTSSYASMWGIPLALFGIVMYLVLTVLGLLMLRARSEWEHMLALGVYAVSLAGIVFTGYLYYLEIFVLHAFCSWCIISSIVLVSIFILSITNFVSIKRRLDNTPHTRRFKISDYVQW